MACFKNTSLSDDNEAEMLDIEFHADNDLYIENEESNGDNITALQKKFNNIVIDNNSIIAENYDYDNIKNTLDKISTKIDSLQQSLYQMSLFFHKQKAIIEAPTTNSSNNNNKRSKEIIYDKEPYILPLRQDTQFYLRIITNLNGDQIGKVIGKNGCNLNRLRKVFNVTVAYPNIEDNQNFPAVVIIQNNNNERYLINAVEDIMNTISS